MEAKVTWKKRMSFDGTADTGFVLPLGTEPAVGGDNDGFRPMELFLLGLAGCTAMDVISILIKKQVKVNQFEVLVHAEKRAEHPRIFTHAVIEYVVGGENVELKDVERAVALSTEKYCPGHAMLSKAVPITTKITLL